MIVFFISQADWRLSLSKQIRDPLKTRAILVMSNTIVKHTEERPGQTPQVSKIVSTLQAPVQSHKDLDHCGHTRVLTIAP